MRGEDVHVDIGTTHLSGSPPHARGRPQFPKYGEFTGRITPACAGKTHFFSLEKVIYGDHPRMRGEDVEGKSRNKRRYGSPPHARGRL